MKSFIPWIGGKTLLAKKIVSMFPENSDRYIEVFGGGASVLFYKDKHAPLEVYNDANSQLVNLFRCIKYHRGELQKEISGYLNSREIFEDIRARIDMRGFTDIQRAAMFYMQIKISYGADGRTYGCNKKNINTDYLEEIEERLIRILIILLKCMIVPAHCSIVIRRTIKQKNIMMQSSPKLIMND